MWRQGQWLGNCDQARGHVPLDDFRNLGLPVGDRLLLGCQILQLILQLPILSRELVHKGAELVGNSGDT